MRADLVWVGLDVGEVTTSVCVIGAGGEPLLEGRCPTTPESVVGYLAAFPAERIAVVAVEAGSVSHLVRKLRAPGLPVEMFEARKASKFLALRRSKTDESDARGLADLRRLGRHAVAQVILSVQKLSSFGPNFCCDRSLCAFEWLSRPASGRVCRIMAAA